MKKLFAILALFAVVLSLSACATKVAGKTFTYDSFEYELAEGLTKVEAGIAEAAVTVIKKGAENIDITFNEDGTCTLGSYTQDGSKVLIGDVEYKAAGGKLVLEVETDEYSYKITYVESK